MSAHSAPLPASGLASPTRRSVARWTRLASTGLFLIAFAPSVMVASGLVAGLELGEDLGFFATMIGVPAITAVLVLRFGTWAKVLGILVSIAAGLSMFWMAFGLGFPTAFADFTPGLALVLGVFAGLGGSVAAIVAGRRGQLAPAAAGSERRGIIILTGIVGLAAVVSLGLDLSSGATVAAEEATATSTMRDFLFAEETITVQAGEESKVLVHNSDPFVHDFAVPALGVEPVVVGPGEAALVTIAAAEPGTYTIYCTLHSDTDAPDGGEDGMAATLVVE